MSERSKATAATVADLPEKPNVIVVFCDDLGWGDLSCQGHPTIATPHLDRMAQEGMRLTQFYVAASVCTPSRAGLMTGRYPVRTGMWGKRRVLFPDSVGGIQDSEWTMAEVAKSRGYATGMVGKWHLGHLEPYLPTRHGFDSYFGIPYSNDMDKVGPLIRAKNQKIFRPPNWKHFNVPLLRSTVGNESETVERPTDQRTITRRYTYEAVDFIRENQEQPFFLYLPHSLPHVPLFRSDAFVGHSLAGLYGDVIEEIDWSVGQILDELRKLELAEKTLVLFTSDNGPWLSFGDQGGSAGPLRNGKGTTFEGGMRVPAIAWMPGMIPAGVVQRDLASTLDMLPTFAAMSGAELPEDLILDGYDLTGMLVEQRPSPRKRMYYYRDNRLMAIREGRYKAHFIIQDSYTSDNRPRKQDTPLLYDLELDISEKRDLAKTHPEVVARFMELRDQQLEALVPAPSQLDRKE